MKKSLSFRGSPDSHAGSEKTRRLLTISKGEGFFEQVLSLIECDASREH